jgi:hypothetical protein
MNLQNKKQKPRNPVARDLKSPKYRMRVVDNKRYKKDKHPQRTELYAFS